MLITDEFITHAQNAPGKIALIMGDACLNYGDLLAAAQQVALAIDDTRSEHSKQRSEYFFDSPLVGLLTNNCIEFFEIFLGASMIGAVAMVLDPKWTSKRVRQLLWDWPPDVLFINDQLFDDQSSHLLPVIETVLIGKTRGQQWAAYLGWRQSYESNVSRNLSVSEETPFYIGFTSGTTGKPKGFVRVHRSWTASFAASRLEFGINKNDHILAPGPVVNSLTLYATIEGLAAGATVNLLRKFDAVAVIDQISEHPITLLVAVPTMLKAILTTANSQRAKFPMLRALLSSGSKLDPELREALQDVFPNADVFEYYGASELSFVTVNSSREEGAAESIGRPFYGVEISIRREKTKEVVMPGEIGQLWVKSEFICSGYLDSREETSFDMENGWASVGDIAWCDASGYVHLVGRKQDMLISGGLNVYPLELELALQNFPEVAEAAVIGLPDKYWGDLVCAVVRWQGTARLTMKQLTERLVGIVENYKFPRRLFAISRFPQTASGKVSRVMLREQILTNMPTIVEIR